MTNKYPRVGIGVLIFNEQKLLLGQRKNSHGANTWAPPGGHLEFGESFEDCGRREVKEETGLVLDSTQWVAVSNDIFREEDKHYVTLFLRAEYPKNQNIQNLEPEKNLGWEWIRCDALPEQLFLPLKNLIRDKGIKFLL